MVNTSKPQLLEHFTTADFDQVVDLVLSRMSPSFLDRALAQRLETIDARSLVNALARAERLGYDVQDIIEEKTSDKPEHVIPSLTSMPPLPTPFEPLATPSRGQWTQPPQYGQSILVPPGSQAPTQPTWYNPSPPPLPSQHFAQPPTKGPAGIHYCQDCHRPCSGAFALQYVSCWSPASFGCLYC